MFGLQQALRNATRQLPTLALEQLVAQKLKAAGISAPNNLSKRVAEHLLRGGDEPFVWDNGGSDKQVTLSFSDEDLATIERAMLSLVGTDALVKLADELTKSILKSLKAQWNDHKQHEQVILAAFRNRLEERWGAGLNLLQMLLVVCQEIGSDISKRLRRSKALKNRPTRELLLRLHSRSCQVVGEIISLIESGFADGAIARWRTLHEIAVIAAMVREHGDDLARRYVAHLAVESKRAMDQYARTAPLIGFKPLSKREAKRIDKKFNVAIKKYGVEFGTQYGWAAHHLKVKKPNFSQLEDTAGRGVMRSHYKMASQNVHAGPHGIFFRVGLLNQTPVLLAGPSNAGFFDPGHLAAHTLVQTTILLFAGRAMLDEVVMMKVLISIDDEITRAFARAERQLTRDDKTLRNERSRATRK